MKYSAIIKDYFAFNQRELRGIAVLITLIFLVLMADILVPVMCSPGDYPVRGMNKEVVMFMRDMRIQDSLEDLQRKKLYENRRSGVFHGATDSLHAFRYPAKPVIRIELNSADTFSLQQLRGIGPGFARRIIRYRDKLGGFINKRQVLEVFGMDTARYNGIEASLDVNPDSIRRININTITFKELLSHPYFPFGITKAIMIYRKDKKKFSCVEELKKVEGMADTTFRKILPYIRIE
jgi:DNA uptake protein ComE-like DNA-binding protein